MPLLCRNVLYAEWFPYTAIGPVITVMEGTHCNLEESVSILSSYYFSSFIIAALYVTTLDFIQ
jgi:hypothetical protein